MFCNVYNDQTILAMVTFWPLQEEEKEEKEWGGLAVEGREDGQVLLAVVTLCLSGDCTLRKSEAQI